MPNAKCTIGDVSGHKLNIEVNIVCARFEADLPVLGTLMSNTLSMLISAEPQYINCNIA